MKVALAAFRAKPLPERICLAVLALATLFYTGASAWEAFGPLECGHFCALSYVGIAGENMLTWRMFAVVVQYTAGHPTPEQYYAHHPYGLILVGAVAQALFGHNSFSIHAPAIIYGAFIPPLTFGIARATWGYVAGAIATVVFVLVPIDLAFAKFGLYELTTIFWGLLFMWGTVRLWQSWKTRHLVAAIAGAIGVCQADWIGSLLTGSVAGFALVRAYVLPRRWVGLIHDRKHAQWFAATLAAAIGTVLLYVLLFAKSGHLADLLGSYESRSSGAASFLSLDFGPRRWMWIRWTLPTMTLSAMAIGVPLALVRTFTVSTVEVMLPAWFFSSAVQYLLFKQGADVHIFWPHMFGVAVALACGCLAAQAIAWSDRLLAVVPASSRSRLSAGLTVAGAAAIAVYVVVLGRMGLTQLRQSHLTSGQFDEGGNYVFSYRNGSTFVEWAMRELPSNYNLVLHNSFVPAPNIEYTAHRVLHTARELTPTSSNDPDRHVLAFAGLLSANEMKNWAQLFAPEIAGPFWKIDRARAHEPLVVYRYVEREPSLWESFFVTGTDAIRSIGPVDPYATWEWRSSLGVVPNPRPTPVPSTFDEIRIAHNAALQDNDVDEARRLRDKLKAYLTETKEATLSGDVRLLGLRIEDGSVPIVTLLWEAGPSFVPFDGEFHVRSKVVRPPPLWPSVTDYYEKEVAPKEALRPVLWKPGFLYAQRFVVLHRVGEERYRGFFTTGDGRLPPRPTTGENLELFTLN
jgi:hypothetical protein